MNELNELQNIWKSGVQGDKKNTGHLPESLPEKLRKLENHQDKLNRLKILVLILIFAQMVYWINRFDRYSLHVYLGLGIIFLSTVLFMTYYFRKQFNSRKLNFNNSSVCFAREAIQMIEKQIAIFRLPFLIFVVFIVAGANIMLWGLYRGDNKLSAHLNYTFFISASSCIGFLIRRRRTRKEVLPLLDELKKLEETINADSE